MTSAAPTFLPLAAGDDATAKVVVGFIVFVAWIVAQAVGAVRKARDKRLPPSTAKPRGVPAGRPPPPWTAPKNVPASQRRPPSKPLPPLARRGPGARPAPPPPPPVRVTRQPVLARPAPARPVLSSPITSSLRPPTLSGPARPTPPDGTPAIARLVRPQNLRAAVLLSEVLRPPVALRDPNGTA